MPRIARAIAAGFPHHIIQRGNNKQDVFFQPEDRTIYLSILKRYSMKWSSPALAYCLMTNHVHLLLRPLAEKSLYKIMQGLSLCYTQYVNKTYNRSGRLWESRYHSSIIEQEAYLWAVARYIEQNPVRARMFEHPEDYAFSSARAHVLGQKDEALLEALFPDELRNDYADLLGADISENDLKAIRQCTKTGRPLGDEIFTLYIGKQLGRNFKVQPRGRPRTKK